MIHPTRQTHSRTLMAVRSSSGSGRPLVYAGDRQNPGQMVFDSEGVIGFGGFGDGFGDNNDVGGDPSLNDLYLWGKKTRSCGVAIDCGIERSYPSRSPVESTAGLWRVSDSSRIDR